MSYFSAVSNADFERLLAEQTYPHQAAPLWDAYTDQLPGRKLWRGTRWLYSVDGLPRVAMTIREFTLRKMEFLWMQDGPVWIGSTPEAADEELFFQHLMDFVRSEDSHVAFIRLNAFNDSELLTDPCQDLCFHDTTVVISLEGDEEAIRGRMKTRGRRMVNKALRESGTEVRDRTDIDREGFESLLAIMDETSERQEFTALSHEQYWTLFTAMREQGAARLYVGYIDDEPVNWALYTLYHRRAQYEVAASNEKARQARSTTTAVYHALLELQKEGYTELDLVAIGSDYNPRLNGLNQFKMQWVKEPTYVGRPMELVLKPLKYKFMNVLAHLMGR